VSAPRRVVANLLYSAMCIGGFVLFLAVFGVAFALLHAVLGAAADAFQLNPKGFVGGLLQYVIPAFVSLSLAFGMLTRLDPLWVRLERWKTQ
jgi:hypothetical protein